MDVIMYVVLLDVLACIVLLGVLLFKVSRKANEQDMTPNFTALSNVVTTTLEASRQAQRDQLSTMNNSMNHQLEGCRSDIRLLTETTERHLDGIRQSNESKIDEMRRATSESLSGVSETINRQLDGCRSDIKSLSETTERHLDRMQQGNEKKLEEMRQTVDEKLNETLNKRLTESFTAVSEQLQQVYEGLGEMKTLAQGVGDLKKVLSNVKTRGVLGEIQLKAIISEILTPDQYDENVITVPGTTNRVEFAVKLPVEDGRFVYLPIDSKFPGDTYAALRDAYDNGSRADIDNAVKALIIRLKAEAKDIHEKYIQVPHTTEFGLMFLPFEGLYAEAVNRGMVEALQKEYKVNIVGPSTMAAMLNSLQMSFRTIAIQKRSSEVWDVLGAVQTEFDKFEGCLLDAQKRIDQAGKELDNLVGVRTRAIKRKLRGVAALPETVSSQILALEEGYDE